MWKHFVSRVWLELYLYQGHNRLNTCLLSSYLCPIHLEECGRALRDAWRSLKLWGRTDALVTVLNEIAKQKGAHPMTGAGFFSHTSGFPAITQLSSRSEHLFFPAMVWSPIISLCMVLVTSQKIPGIWEGGFADPITQVLKFPGTNLHDPCASSLVSYLNTQ